MSNEKSSKEKAESLLDEVINTAHEAKENISNGHWEVAWVSLDDLFEAAGEALVIVEEEQDANA